MTTCGQGMTLSRECYETRGRQMLHTQFASREMQIAAGLVGEGSECFGFDDVISRDHDFDSGFCLWVSDATYEEIGEQLQSAYEEMMRHLPRKPDSVITKDGSRRRGVCRISDFYAQFTGLPDGPHTWREWLVIPEALLAAATNGCVFSDPTGDFTAIRDRLLVGYPEDVRRKKLAARIARMAQTGQYNVPRSQKRGDMGAAALALHGFVQETIHACFLLNNRYCPYYKWMFRAMRDLPALSWLAEPLEELATGGVLQMREQDDRIEEIARTVARTVKEQGLSEVADDFLLPHAEAIMRHIEDPEIRALHVTVGAGA